MKGTDIRVPCIVSMQQQLGKCFGSCSFSVDPFLPLVTCPRPSLLIITAILETKKLERARLILLFHAIL